MCYQDDQILRDHSINDYKLKKDSINSTYRALKKYGDLLGKRTEEIITMVLQ